MRERERKEEKTEKKVNEKMTMSMKWDRRLIFDYYYRFV